MKSARQRIPQRTETLSLILAVALVLLVAMLAYRTWSAYDRRTDEMEISRRVASATNQLLSTLKDAETGQRGFLLTGADRYLQPYQDALAEIPLILRTLTDVTAHNRPDQAGRIERLRLPIQNKLAELEQTVELRRSQGFDAALAVVLTDRGKAEMDQIRSICGEIQTAADERLVRVSEEARASANQLGLIGTVGSIALFVLLLFSTITVQRATRRRQQLIEQLQESEERVTEARDWLQTTLGSIGDAVIATDSTGRVSFLNGVAQSLTGWPQEEAAGKPLEQILVIRNEKTGAIVENPVSKVLREGQIVGLANHTVLTTRDGRDIPIEDSAAPIRDQNHRILGTVLVFRDVTGRRIADDTIARSEERLKLALEAGRIGVWDWDIIRNHIDWSDLVYDIHGVERGKFAGGVDEFAGLVHPDDRDRINQAIRTALQGATYNVEFRVIHPNGKVGWVATTAMVFRNEHGEATRMLGATTDVTARKQADALLRQQWHTFDVALSNTPDFTYVFDLEGRFSYVNRALLSLWQKPLEEAVGKNFFDLGYPPELAARLQRQIQEVIETREPVRDHTPFTGPTGETRHYEYIFVPVLSADARVEAVTGSTRDITERNQAEAALRTSEERLTLALEAGGGVGTWDWDIPSDRVYCNPQFAALFSMEPQTGAAGAPLSQFIARIHSVDQNRVRESIAHAVATGGDFSEEYRVVQSNGSVRWVQARGRGHLDEAGNPNRFPGVAFDTTQRKRAEDGLRESQGRLRAIFDGTYEYIGLLAPDGTLLEANRASLTFANNTRADVIGCPFWDTPWFTATPGASEAVKAGIERAAAGEFIRFEAMLRRPSGECTTFDISFHPVRNEYGEVVLIVPEERDITERKRAEEDLSRSHEKLTRVNRELEEFAYVASHDLQEPLRMVNIYTQIILRDVGEREDLARYAGFVQQGVTRMEVLIHDLLTFSRTVHADEEPVGQADLSASLNEALSVLKNRIEESGSLVTADPMPPVRADTSQMAHVFQNLLSNALKYRRDGEAPRIHIAARRDAGYCIVSVQDNGIGFEPQYSERIFGLFKRLHKNEYPGTGLGLAICRRIVERYGGRIWADGKPGEGATFYFSLPSAEDQ